MTADDFDFAIGQAEVSITPLQAANLMAVYASGDYMPVTLIRELGDERRWRVPADPEHWQVIRRGLYRVVNDVAGTARRTAYLAPSSGFALCGKTGSAEAYRRRGLAVRDLPAPDHYRN